MNNENLSISSYFQQTNSLFLLTTFGKLLLKLLFNSHSTLKKCSDTPSLKEGNKDDLLYFSSENNFQSHLRDFALIYNKESIMRNPLSFLYTHLKEEFDRKTVQKGRFISNNIVVVKSQPICVNITRNLSSICTKVIFDSLTKKCLNLLECREIIDLIIEKEILVKVLTPSESLERVTVNETEEYFENYNKAKINYHIANTKKCKSISFPTIISSDVIIFKKFKPYNFQYEDSNTLKYGGFECQAKGDIIEKNLENIKADEKENSQLSRIVKAQKWIQNIKKEQVKCRNNVNLKCFKNETFNPIRNEKHEKKSVDKNKRQRYIVKKNSDKTEDKLKIGSTNSSNVLTAKVKSIKKRFIVLKQFQENFENNATNKKQNNLNYKKKRKYVKFKDQKEFSMIREDVINLANEIQKHYIKHSKNMVSTTGSSSEKLSNIEEREKVDKDVILKEIRSRLRLKKKITKDDLESDDSTPNAAKLKSSEKSKRSGDHVPSHTTISSNQNPLNSKYHTATDTTYQSIYSNNSPPLNSFDLKDIHLMSDEIHNFAEKEMMKTF